MKIIRIFFLVSFFVGSANAAIISTFTDNFENGLGLWTGKNGGAHNGILVDDPLNQGYGKVLTFTNVNSAGDIFTIDTVQTSTVYQVSFDYLGTCNSTDCGGYFGISQDTPGTHYWVAGTGSYSTPIALIDDNTWHHYDLTFSSNINPAHFMLEDWIGSGSTAGDIYFDNLSFYDVNTPPQATVPEPSILAIMGLGLFGFGIARRKQK